MATDVNAKRLPEIQCKSFYKVETLPFMVIKQLLADHLILDWPKLEHEHCYETEKAAEALHTSSIIHCCTYIYR